MIFQDLGNPCSGNREVLIHFVTEEEMSEMNHEFKQKEGPTDILTFPYYEKLPDGGELTGELYICMEKVRENARLNHKKISEELLFIVAHGCLHLLGREHPDDESLQSMMDLQNEFVQKVI